jgi:hypothetical protein
VEQELVDAVVDVPLGLSDVGPPLGRKLPERVDASVVILADRVGSVVRILAKEDRLPRCAGRLGDVEEDASRARERPMPKTHS